MWFPLSRYKVVGHSMEPTLKDGDTLWVNRLSYLFSSPKLDDIVTIQLQGQRGKVLLKKIKKVTKDSKYFVEGLNKTDSYDSRHFGPIDKNKILGKVIKKY